MTSEYESHLQEDARRLGISVEKLEKLRSDGLIERAEQLEEDQRYRDERTFNAYENY